MSIDKIAIESEFEREALDMIDTTSKQVESLANDSELPNGSEWKNGDECIYSGQPDIKCKFVAIHPNNEKCAIVLEGGGDINLSCVAIDCLSKPESQEQKAERERDERLLSDMMSHPILHDCITHLGDFASAVQLEISISDDDDRKLYWVRRLERINDIQSFVDKTNYRKDTQ